VEGDFRLGEWLVQPMLGALQGNGRSHRIEPKCMQVLVRLANQPGEVVSKEELIRAVWADTFVTDEVLTRAISELRHAFSDDAKHPQLIETIPKIGYRIIAPVQPVPVKHVTVKDVTVSDGKVPWKPSWKQVSAFLLLLCSAALILALVMRLSRARVKPEVGRIQSIAVLPMEDLSRDPEQEYFANGMTDELINKLAQIKALRVVSRSSVMQFEGSHKTPAEVAKLLNVDAVVEATILRSDNRLRINAELIDGRSDKQLWAQSYNRDLSDVLGVQSDLAQAIVKGIEVSTSPDEGRHLARRETTSPEAYDAYLKGVFYWNQFSEKGMRKAADYFQQAIAKDPNYAQAYAGLAQTYHELSFYIPPREVMPKAKAAANRALQLDDSVTDAHAALGWVLWAYDWDWKNAEREFLKAIELEPNNGLAHGEYSDYLYCARRTDDAMGEMIRARELEPFSAIIATSMGETYEGMGRYDDAERIFLTTIEMHPEFSEAHVSLGETYVLQHRFPQGIQEIRKGIDLDTDPSFQASLIWAHVQAGDTSNAHKQLGELLRSTKSRYIYPFAIASAYASVGDKERCLQWLRRAVEERNFGVLWLEQNLIFVRYVREDPRFRKLVEQIRTGSQAG
jgi:TolB-like protein/DNA-binding winged helix-turn-helix (wHTH) protein